MKLPQCISLSTDKLSLIDIGIADQVEIEMSPGLSRIMRKKKFGSEQDFAKAVVRLAVRGAARCNKKSWAESITGL